MMRSILQIILFLFTFKCFIKLIYLGDIPVDLYTGKIQDFLEVKRRCGCAKKNYPMLYKDNSAYIYNRETLCSGKTTDLLIVIHSKPDFSARRFFIRNSWGSLRRIRNYQIGLVFVMGNPNNSTTQHIVDEESNKYRDIIQRDFHESYRNMTIKHLFWMQWVSQYCSNAKYILKADDDTFVDIFHVVRLLETFNLSNMFYCTATSGAVPQRNEKNPRLKKWIVTQLEYPGKVYPDYCEGLAYIMPTSFAPKLFWCSLFSHFFWIDDVYVTGVLAEKLGFVRRGFYSGHVYSTMKPIYASEHILNVVFLYAQHNEFALQTWLRYWRAVLEYSMVL